MTKMKTKALGILLCLTLLLSIIPAQAATENAGFVSREQAVVSLLNTVGLGALNEAESDLSAFADANRVSAQYVDEIGIAVTNGILSGTSGKLLNPQVNITRLEFAMVVSHSMRELPAIKAGLTFSDVPASASGDVNRLVKAGLMSGYDNGLFGSDDYLTQEHLLIVLNLIEDLSARLQDDFYYAVNHEWFDTTRLPAGYPGIMTFDEVDRSNTSKLKAITQELLKNEGTYAEGTKEQKIADFYSSVLDMENRNKQGIDPIRKYLDQFDGAKNVQELLSIMVQFEKETGVNALFSFGPSADMMDSSRYSLYGTGLSTSLPAAYMLMDNPQIKALYEGFLAQLFMLSGISEDRAMAEAQSVYAFEKTIAGSTQSNEQASKIENLYNPVSRDDLAKMFTKVDIKSYLSELGYGSVENLIITDVGLMKKTGELLSDENLEVLKSYARVRLIMNAASFLSQNLKDTMTAFNSTFLGISSVMSEEDSAFNLVNSVMSGYMGRMYVEKYFSAEAKKDVENIVAEIIAAYQKRIEKLDWMSSETKDAAISKLKAIKVKIGYPDTWNDPLSGISMKTYDNGGSLLGNIFAIFSAEVSNSKTLLTKPVDKSQWLMPPHTVNAYYNVMNNEIVFPAGILQAPFYDVKATREQNLGGIGAIIAHEITHAFDNNGAQFDEKGNMSNWWTQNDYVAFQQKCQSVIDLYQGLEIAPDAIVNGSLTVSENVADIGSMACILEIAKSMPNADYKQLFESNARIWRFTASGQMYQMLASQDVHAPNKFRVNRVLPNFQEFYDTYGIKIGDVLYLAPEKRVTVW